MVFKDLFAYVLMKLKFRVAWFSANTQMNLLVSGDPDTNYSTFSDLDKLVCHILVYYVGDFVLTSSLHLHILQHTVLHLSR